MQGFTAAEVDRARRYHRPLYAALVVDAALGFGVLGVLAFSRLGEELYDAVEPWPWPLRTVAYAALVVAVGALVRLPLGFWRGYVYERRWGFSTQTLHGWAIDRASSMPAEIFVPPEKTSSQGLDGKLVVGSRFVSPGRAFV